MAKMTAQNSGQKEDQSQFNPGNSISKIIVFQKKEVGAMTEEKQKFRAQKEKLRKQEEKQSTTTNRKTE